MIDGNLLQTTQRSFDLTRSHNSETDGIPANSHALGVILTHACQSKISISRQLTLTDQFLMPSWKFWDITALTDTLYHCRVWILQTVSECIVKLDTNSLFMFGNLWIVFGNVWKSSEHLAARIWLRKSWQVYDGKVMYLLHVLFLQDCSTKIAETSYYWTS